MSSDQPVSSIINESARRTAFILQPSSVLSHASTSSPQRITSIAIDSVSRKIFLGLGSGQVEEHEILSSGSTTTARKVSDRKVVMRSSSGAVTEICCIPNSSCLIARMEDRSVQVAPYDSAHIWPLPGVKHDASAMACDSPYPNSSPSKSVKAGSRLAVSISSLSISPGGFLSSLGLGGVSSSSSSSSTSPTLNPHLHETSKILVYSVGTGPGGMSPLGHSQPAHLLFKVQIPHPHVSMLSWVGDSIIAALPGSGGYLLIRSGQQVSEIAMGVTSFTLVASGPCSTLSASSSKSGREGLVLFNDSILLIVDEQGQAVRQPLILPDQRPLSVVLTGQCTLVVMDGYFLVYDSASCQMIQLISFNHDDPWVSASGRMPAVYDEATGSIFVATSSCVRRLERVQEDKQAWELLKSRRYSQALTLASSTLAAMSHQGHSEGSGWPGRVIAQAGWMLLVMEGKVKEAIEAFMSCPISEWQPIQILALFPDLQSKWIDIDPSSPSSISLSKLVSRPYWGLHLNGGTMPSLESLCILQGSPNSPRSRFNLGLNELKDAIARYLNHSREMSGVLFIELIDTLLVTLLCDTGESRDLETLVSSSPTPSPSRVSKGARTPCCAMLREAVAAMEASHRWHALALFRSTRGQYEDALDIWRDLSDGAIHESPSSSSSSQQSSGSGGGGGERDLAGIKHLSASSSSQLLCSQPTSGAFSCSLTVTLTHLPWILAASPDSAVQILRKRHDITLTQGLALLSGGRNDDVRWLYLWSLVHERELGGGLEVNLSTRAMIHTELALELVECIQREHASDSHLISERMERGFVNLESHIEKLLQNPKMPWRPGRAQVPPHTSHVSSSIVSQSIPITGQQPRPIPPPEALLASISIPQSLLPYLPVSDNQVDESWLIQARRMVRMRTALMAHLCSQPPLVDPNMVLKALGPLPMLQGREVRPPSHEGREGDQEKDQGDALSSLTVSSSMSPVVTHQILAQHLTRRPPDQPPIEGLPLPSPLLLIRERVILLSRKGDHGSALRLLALHEEDLEASISYCHQHSKHGREQGSGSSELWLILLDVLLRGGREPKYSSAIRVLQEEGGGLDPLEVLSALPDSMPLHIASETLRALLEGVMHRRRMGQVVKGLHRSRNLEARVERAACQSLSFIVEETRCCASCHRPLLDKVVVCFPNSGGVRAMCAKCGAQAQAQAQGNSYN